MPDDTTSTSTKSPSKSELEDENARLRALLEEHGIDAEDDPNRGIVGNLADMQRLGAAAVGDGPTNIEDAIVPFKPEPPAEVNPAASDTQPASAK